MSSEIVNSPAGPVKIYLINGKKIEIAGTHSAAGIYHSIKQERAVPIVVHMFDIETSQPTTPIVEQSVINPALVEKVTSSEE